MSRQQACDPAASQDSGGHVLRHNIGIRQGLNPAALKRAALVTAVILIEAVQALAQHAHFGSGAGCAPETPTEPVRRIIVSVPDRKLALI